MSAWSDRAAAHSRLDAWGVSKVYGFAMDEPGPENDFLAEHVSLMLDSYRHFVGDDLLSREGSPVDVARRLFESGVAVISHDTADDPVFNYGNRAILDLFEMTWAELTVLPSRMSAEPVNRDERERLMERVREQGYIDDYSGVRISSTGKRFLINRATVWNLVDARGELCGQAAAFTDWEPVE